MKQLLVLIMTLTLFACGGKESDSSMEDAAEAAKEATSDAMESAKGTMEDTAEAAGEVTDDAMKAAEDAMDDAKEMAGDAMEKTMEEAEAVEDKLMEKKDELDRSIQDAMPKE